MDLGEKWGFFGGKREILGAEGNQQVWGSFWGKKKVFLVSEGIVRGKK